MNGFASVGLVWTIAEFHSYLRGLKRPAWVDSICLHHTASPTLAQRPGGLNRQHIRNLHDYYQRKLGWKSGPHLFIDDTDKGIMGMTPLDARGVHAVSFNSRAIGIEVLGYYDREDPKSGRGLACWRNAAAATKALLDWLTLPANATTVLFHRDDKKTQKSCPGTLVEKGWVLGLIGGAK